MILSSDRMMSRGKWYRRTGGPEDAVSSLKNPALSESSSSRKSSSHVRDGINTAEGLGEDRV